MRLTEMSNRTNVKKINKVMESRFGFKIDYDNLTFTKAYNLARGLTEGLETIKKTHGAHTAEQNPKYMEMFMVREGLHRWMVENEQQFITESEMAKSEAILAAKDMVDSVQDMLEKVSKMQNEQMPALLDTIRDQIGTDKAEGFKSAVMPVLDELSSTLQRGRESADLAARELAGEAVAPQPMELGGDDLGGDLGGDELGQMPGGELGAPEGDLDSDDGFGATDAAAGGEDELGRERR